MTQSKLQTQTPITKKQKKTGYSQAATNVLWHKTIVFCVLLCGN